MAALPVILILLAFLLVGIHFYLHQTRSQDSRSRTIDSSAIQYKSARSLLTPAELRFFRALLATTPVGLYVCPKVRIADLLMGRTRSDFARISQKHVDFVVVDLASSQIVAAVELDDSSHNRARVQRRDEFVNSAFASAGLPIIRVEVRSDYQAEMIWQEVRSKSSSDLRWAAA